MTQYPVMLSVDGRRCLVVGGGKIAARKVDGLVAAGADVTVIARTVDPSIAALPVTIEQRPYLPGDACADFRLVITATDDPDVNALVYADAEAAGVWVNSADDPEHCSFTLPAIHRDGDVTVAIAPEARARRSPPGCAIECARACPPACPKSWVSSRPRGAAVHEAGGSTEARDWRPRIEELAAGRPGRGTVHLVGAGPGDPELLTLRAARAPRDGRRRGARRPRRQ